MNTEYKKRYDELVAFWQANPPSEQNGYCEKHHIVLKSLGGREMVKVPVMVHLELHYMYVKIYEGSTDSDEVIAYHKALNAITKMLNGKSMQKKHIDFEALSQYDKDIICKMREEAAKAKRGTTVITNLKTGKRIRYPKELPIPDGWVNKFILTDEEKAKRSKISGSSRWIQRIDGTENKFVRANEVQSYLDTNEWKLGRCIFPDGWHERQSEFARSVCRAGKCSNMGRRWIHNANNEVRTIPKDEPLPEGWIEGRGELPEETIRRLTESNRDLERIARRVATLKANHKIITPESHARRSKASKGRTVITDGHTEKRVLPDEVQTYLDAGWKLGRNPMIVFHPKPGYKHSDNIRQKIRDRMAGCRMMTNGVRNTQVMLDKQQEFLDNGYWFGRTKKPKQ